MGKKIDVDVCIKGSVSGSGFGKKIKGSNGVSATEIEARRKVFSGEDFSF